MKNTITVTKAEIHQRYKPVDNKTHKGQQGHALLIGGSYGKIGAMCLSSKAALKSGCGVVTAFIPECGYGILQTAVPEVMVLVDNNDKFITGIDCTLQPQAIGIGPGFGQDIETQKALNKFLESSTTPLVIDADALNILSLNPSWLSLVPVNTILTPHLKELERLIGPWASELELMKMAVDFSIKHNVIIVMKGAPTQIIDGEMIYINTTGNAALATAGSGDVLTGIITGFLAQSYTPIDAALIGVYIHGLTADIALHDTGQEAFIASDIIAWLGKAFRTLKYNPATIGFR